MYAEDCWLTQYMHGIELLIVWALRMRMTVRGARFTSGAGALERVAHVRVCYKTPDFEFAAH